MRQIKLATIKNLNGKKIYQFFFLHWLLLIFFLAVGQRGSRNQLHFTARVICNGRDKEERRRAMESLSSRSCANDEITEALG